MSSPETTISEALMLDVLERLQMAIISPVPRRDHPTPALRSTTPRVILEMGDDQIKKDGSCEQTRVLRFDVCIVVRAEATYAATDPVIMQVYRALDPNLSPNYPFHAIIRDRGIRRSKPEVADLDALEVYCDFEFEYRCKPFALEEESGDAN